jgi:hypothetical protein
VSDQRIVGERENLAAALKAGDLAAAQAAYIKARPFYERIEPVAESFPAGLRDSPAGARPDRPDAGPADLRRFRCAVRGAGEVPGSTSVARKIRMEIEARDTDPLTGQERIFARVKTTGAPITGGDEFTPSTSARPLRPASPSSTSMRTPGSGARTC